MPYLNSEDFRKKCEADFGLPPIRLYKSKASHMMTTCDGFDVALHGPEVGGYNDSCAWQAVTVNGWGFALVDGEWRLVSDGIIGWRRGENPRPEIPATGIQLFSW